MVVAWRRGFEFELVVQNQHMVSILVYGEPSFSPWGLTFIHSSCDTAAKEAFWLELENVGTRFGGPWIVLVSLTRSLGNMKNRVEGLMPPPLPMVLLGLYYFRGWLMWAVWAHILRGAMGGMDFIKSGSGWTKALLTVIGRFYSLVQFFAFCHGSHLAMRRFSYARMVVWVLV